MGPKSGEVRFNTTGASIAGSLSGAAIAIGAPWVLLRYGTVLPGSTLTILVSVAVGAGALITLASAFFGLVLPSQTGWEEPHSAREPGPTAK